MARTGELSARQVAALTEPGRHRVADNLFLLLKPPRKSWLNMFTCPVTRREHEMGLGPVSLVSVPQAKAIVLRHRTLVHEGRCPLCEKRGRTRAPKPVAFKEVAGHYVSSRQALWRSAEHRRQWDVSLATHAKAIWDLPVATIDTGAVMQVLEPEWRTKAPTLSRVRGRIEQILDFAAVRGWRSGENPARWRGHLDKLLPSPKKLNPVQHLAALPWPDAPVSGESWPDGPTCRPGASVPPGDGGRRGEPLEAAGTRSIASAVWTIPADRTKSGRDHRVPFSPAALRDLTPSHGPAQRSAVSRRRSRPTDRRDRAARPDAQPAAWDDAARVAQHVPDLGCRGEQRPPPTRRCRSRIGARHRGQDGRGLSARRSSGPACRADGGLGNLSDRRSVGLSDGSQSIIQQGTGT